MSILIFFFSDRKTIICYVHADEAYNSGNEAFVRHIWKNFKIIKFIYEGQLTNVGGLLPSDVKSGCRVFGNGNPAGEPLQLLLLRRR